MWEFIFGAGNLLALLMWAALIILPRWPALLAAILYIGVGLLCLAYVCGVVGLLTGTLDGGGQGAAVDFTTIEGVRSIFESDGGTTIGWLHYLAFDLFVGIWIARDADDKGFARIVQAPILLATFMVGPLGLLIWLAVREKKARGQERSQ